MPAQNGTNDTVLNVEIRPGHKAVVKAAVDDTVKPPRIVSYDIQHEPLSLGKGRDESEFRDPDASAPRILILGDSWAQYMWKYKRYMKLPFTDWEIEIFDSLASTPFKDALEGNGIERNKVAGELTALGATRARDWVDPTPSPTGDYLALLGHLREFRDQENDLSKHPSKHQDLASMELIRNTLEHFRNIDIIHMSLGGNDLFETIIEDSRVKAWCDTLFSDPTVSSEYIEQLKTKRKLPGELLPHELQIRGWKRTDLTPAETSALEAARDEFINDIDSVLMPIRNKIEALIDYIYKNIDPNIMVCISGYTQLFLNCHGYRFDELEKIKQEVLEGKRSKVYYAAPRGIDWLFFNQIIMPAFERLRQKILVRFNTETSERVHFQCFLLAPGSCNLAQEYVNDYFGTKNYETDVYFQKTKQYLVDDGFHLNHDGYKFMADTLIKKYYKTWLSVGSRRAAANT